MPGEYQFADIHGTGLYRLTVDTQGTVTQIQILKRIGPPILDATVLRTFVRWRAQPGPTRIVDVPLTIIPGNRFIRGDEGHLPPRH
jgi:TonB family protein